MTPLTKQRIRYVLADLLGSALGMIVFNAVRFFFISPELRADNVVSFLFWPDIVAEDIFFPFIIVGLYALCGAYNKTSSFFKSRLDESMTCLIVSFVSMLGIFFAVLINDRIPERAPNYVLMCDLWMCLFIPVWLLRMIVLTRLSHRIRRGEYCLPTIAVGLSDKTAPRLQRIMRSSQQRGMSVVAALSLDGKYRQRRFNGIPVVKPGRDLVDTIRRLNAHSLILLPCEDDTQGTANIINKLYSLGMPILVTSDLHGMRMLRPRMSSVVGEPLVDITAAHISPMATNFKRLGDVVISSFALLLLLPVYAVIALAVKRGGGPVFYRQERVGRHKRPFKIIKFRTMQVNAEEGGPALSSEDDPRITPIGRVLRKYRLDELPQFWNVLRGDMSLVGPRPERDYYIQSIMERNPAYSILHKVRPGITSLGMVKYGYATSIDQMLDRMEYDLIYVENISLGLDLKILFYTVRTVVTGRGL